MHTFLRYYELNSIHIFLKSNQNADLFAEDIQFYSRLVIFVNVCSVMFGLI